ncbi:MAG: amino acid ABC transporter ATP-binding protein [Spirochaetaceae bacterium]|nr:amino acid ABC transporter ATP-binding protein [Spirochaetaceae bacterium]
MPMIEVKNIRKSFGSNTVFDDFSVNFDQSGVTVILGPSGTGKSTLLRCINGLETIDAGDILVDSLSVKEKRNLREIRLACGMVFQQTTLFPHLDVLENLVISPVKIQKMDRKEAVDKARALLDKVGLGGREHSKHNELSGGEQQRIAIARAMMMNPRALLLDEITSALDPEMTAEVLRILEKLAGDGVVMLAVTHEISFAQRVADRVIFLEKGNLVADASVDDFFSGIKSNNERIARFLQNISQG